MLGLGPFELVLILGIVVLIFGATRLPQIGEGLGRGIRNFRGAMRDEIDVTPKQDSEEEDDSN